MNDYTLVEEYFLQADQLLQDGSVTHGKQLLEELLEIEPGFGRAHNHLGWIYANKMDDYKRAEFHYKLALRFAPDYPGAYLNYSYLLEDLGRYEELEKLLDKAIDIPGISKTQLYATYGRMYERFGHFKKAKGYYDKVLSLSLNKEEVEHHKEAIKRVKGKAPLLTRMFFL